jgi:hypothetical protein
MLSKSIQMMIISVSIFCMDSSFAMAANLPSKLASSVQVDGLHFQKISFWGRPYPYGFAWRPCYVWRSVLTRYGHHRWYRIRLSDEECRL